MSFTQNTLEKISVPFRTEGRRRGIGDSRSSSFGRKSMNRFFQVLLILSIVALSSLGMMAVHEFGHVLAAWTSGGSVQHVYLHPLALSHTVLAVNPSPLYVVWGGPVFGCLIPLLLLGCVRIFAQPYTYLAAFFAGFCLIANGAYLAGEVFYGGNTLDDGAVILKQGGAVWQLLLFTLATVAFGLWMLNGLGKHFGLSKDESRGTVDRNLAIVIAVILFLVICLELALK